MIGPMVGLGGSNYTPIPISDSATGTFLNSYTLTLSSNSNTSINLYFNESLSLGDLIYIKIRQTSTSLTGNRQKDADSYNIIYNLTSNNTRILTFRTYYNSSTLVLVADSNAGLHLSGIRPANKYLTIQNTGNNNYSSVGIYNIQVYKLKYPNNNKLFS